MNEKQAYSSESDGELEQLENGKKSPLMANLKFKRLCIKWMTLNEVGNSMICWLYVCFGITVLLMFGSLLRVQVNQMTIEDQLMFANNYEYCLESHTGVYGRISDDKLKRTCDGIAERKTGWIGSEEFKRYLEDKEALVATPFSLLDIELRAEFEASFFAAVLYDSTEPSQNPKELREKIRKDFGIQDGVEMWEDFAHAYYILVFPFPILFTLLATALRFTVFKDDIDTLLSFQKSQKKRCQSEAIRHGYLDEYDCMTPRELVRHQWGTLKKDFKSFW